MAKLLGGSQLFAALIELFLDVVERDHRIFGIERFAFGQIVQLAFELAEQFLGIFQSGRFRLFPLLTQFLLERLRSGRDLMRFRGHFQGLRFFLHGLGRRNEQGDGHHRGGQQWQPGESSGGDREPITQVERFGTRFRVRQQGLSDRRVANFRGQCQGAAEPFTESEAGVDFGRGFEQRWGCPSRDQGGGCQAQHGRTDQPSGIPNLRFPRCYPERAGQDPDRGQRPHET
ncbi:MAG: hypothetical protein EA381_02340 [Planctomycetaceae bacterium]|nr:MAG: hypothetical protein EA381_02340 [Planctomycetaceae bacterium]